MVGEIISVGTELLLGTVLNTNSKHIAESLATIGISVYNHTTVGDNKARIKEAFKIAFNRADLVITTGGLGATIDDLTVEAAAEFFDEKIIYDENTLERINLLFSRRGLSPVQNAAQQARIINGSISLKNENGLASGCYLEKNGKTIILLPGPPEEMSMMFDNMAMEHLRKKSEYIFVSKTIHVTGIGEGDAENRIRTVIDNQTSDVSVATYAVFSHVYFRITAKAKTKEQGLILIEPVKKEIYEILGENIYGEDGITVEEAIVNILRMQEKRLAIAESLTGGLVTARFVNVPGASDVLIEGIVAYSDKSKTDRLHINEETIFNYGAVSAHVAEKMAENIKKISKADIGISTTGVAGPNMCKKNNPVGRIYVGISTDEKTYSREFNFFGTREKIRNFATAMVLDILRRELL